uniref:Acylamino-acid-releasing enzyme n=1 Tax=Ananas comosus var. bracteatus TaxID=296719 RepID=A0A6V7QSZ4_ANACO
MVHGLFVKLFPESDAYAVSSLIHMYMELGRVGDARRAFQRISRRDVVSWTTMISGMAKLGFLNDARKLFDETPVRNVVSWTSLIAGYAQADRAEEAIELFTKMLSDNVKADTVTVVVVLSACAQLKDLELGKWIHSFIQKEGIIINNNLVVALIDMYSKCGDVNCAQECFDSMGRKVLQAWNAMIDGLLHSRSIRRISSLSAGMQASESVLEKEKPVAIDEATSEEYASQSKLLQEFTNMPSIDKAWVFTSDKANNSRAMFSISQSNLFANKRKKFVLSSHISKPSKDSVDFEWSPFPIEMTGTSAVVPSPSGTKLLVVRNAENDAPTKLEIWGPSYLEREIHIPQSIHGSLYVDGWFEGISWNHDETLIAYVAEEPPQPTPVFENGGYKKEGSSEKDCGSWKGRGDWEEDWGETYSKKRKPSLFVVDTASGEVRVAEGVSRSISVGQVIWAPSSSNGCLNYLVFVGWSSENGFQNTPRKLGIKYCYNRPCSLFAVCNPFKKSDTDKVSLSGDTIDNSAAAVKLTHGLSSAFFPVFSPDGKYLVFLSAKSAVDSGAHSATNSLHKIDWPTDGKLQQNMNITDVVPVVMSPEDGCFPGLYCSGFLSDPWLSDGCTMVLSSAWRSTQVILSVNVSSCKVSRVSPEDSNYSWNILALDGDNILAVSSSPIDPPQIKYGYHSSQAEKNTWTWMDVSSPFLKYSEKVRSVLSERIFSILKIPVRNPSSDLPKGAKAPIEAIFVSCKDSSSSPTIVILHGGPHSVFETSYLKSSAFLSSLGYNLLIVNYRGSLGFGEEALQSLPGKIGSQDVQDVLTALDYAVEKGLIDSSKVAVLGGSHGGFLTTHLVGQAPDKFVVAAARNPVCNLSLMVGTTDIPDWCYVETCGKEGKNYFSEAPTAEHLRLFYEKSPISHISKVKAPILFLLGAQDLRVPVSNGLQYARALRERGVEVKVIVFPEDVHGIERPQSDFESFLNIGVWFNKYCK